MSTTKKPPKLETSLDYLHWRHFAGAMLDVIDSMKAQASHDVNGGFLHGHKPDADGWAWNSRLLTRLYEAVLKRWCSRTGKDETWFPYSKDGVARMFFRFRKRNQPEIEAWRKEIQKANAT